MGYVDSSGRELVDVGGADITVDLGSVQIEDHTTTSQKASVDTHGSIKTTVADAAGADAVGAKTTAATMPAGGSGLLGWVAAIANYLAGTLTVSGTVTSNDGGTAGTAHSADASFAEPTTGTGLTGYVSAIYQRIKDIRTSLAGTLTVSGTVTTADGTAGSAHSADASFAEPTTGVGSLGYLSAIYQRIKDIRTSLAGTLTVVAPTTAPIWEMSNPATPQSATATHAVNTITLSAGAAGIRNLLSFLWFTVRGTGTAPTQAAPILVTVKDGSTTIFQHNVTGFANGPLLLPPAPLAGTAATSMAISIPDAGASNTSDLNVGYQTG